ncbi:type II and III secretion system protein family protein [Marinobacter orientalis]|uniref:Type II and III secretion system protein family protein n=1 Tax=Marinobacter orientalis TaxID=1928859 RepID=A0A7Y0RBC3_9GAMM|nr:type II and III secretion system protein family protein [Marinobacter orientalis]NMT63093.1 type II and III secretion system protein family protein [Marinobacter orientalis]TGX51752.1 type II and III secretion system protein family protein [Marinobacter orientalis]
MTVTARNLTIEGYLISLVLLCVLVFPAGASAQAMLASGMNRQVVEVAVNQSQILYLEQPVAKISVGNPDIADILILRSRQLYVVGKKLGTTNVTLWDNNNQVVSAVGIEVNHDLESLKSKLYQVLPGEEVEVRSSQDAIILSGEVSSAARMTAALDLARSYQGGDEGRVLNMMQVGGAQQVMLEVQVAEVSRDFLKRIGAKFAAINANSLLTIGAANNGTALAPSGAFVPGGGSGTLTGETPATQILREPMTFESTGLFASFLDGDTLFDLVIDAAQENNLAKVLAEPTLTTLTGQEATFHAGGEFPIPVGSGQDDGITIEFKEFGVSLGFLPTVLDSDMISLKLNIKVSELSNQNSIALDVPETSATFFINALTSRSASSTVELANGQTIGVAGLINENLRERVNKFPGLGDLPVLGNLFRSQEFIKGKTELVILVTPHFARPVDREQFTLPTDYFVEPSDLEFYLLGYTEGRRKPGTGPRSMQRGSVKGQFGHEL